MVVDANVERVVSRLFAIDEPLPGSRRTIREKADSITPDKRSGDFAQAMMDLGSGICTTRDPKCLLCPLAGDCAARADGDPARLPVKAPIKPKPVRQGTAFWIEQDGMVWLETRQGSGMLGGMRSLPDDGWHAGGDGSGIPPVAGEWRELGVVRHTFTHFSLELRVLASETRSDKERNGQWWPVSEIAEAGLPTLFAKAARLALARA